MKAKPVKTHRPAFGPRRGLAMLLVIICLTMATILTTSYLASRDNSAMIGENVAEAAVARWAAESGLEFGVCVLQTQVDWRNAHDNGKTIDDMMVGTAVVDVELTDVQTGLPPTDDTTVVMVTSTANARGVTQIATAIATVTPTPSSQRAPRSWPRLRRTNRLRVRCSWT